MTKYFLNNEQLTKQFNSYNAVHVKLMYHITTRVSAMHIMKTGFDPHLSKIIAFGKGINLTSNIKHLNIYKDDKTNYVIVCLVKYNKKLLNNSHYPDLESGMKYILKHKYSRPTYITIPKIKRALGYDVMYSDDIYVFPNKQQVLPIVAYCI